MTVRANFEELVAALDEWTSAKEVAPGRIEVSIPDGEGFRTVTIVMNEGEWDDVVGPMWGSVADAIDEVTRTLLTMTPDQNYARYEQYRLVPSTGATCPERPIPTPTASNPGGGKWFAYNRDGSRGDRFADFVDPAEERREHWSADREDAETPPDSPNVPPLVTTVPRSPSIPYPIRMFTEHGCPFALWGPLGEPPPTTNAITHPRTTLTLEVTLPLSPSLRDRLLTWGDEWDRKGVDAQEFDERGYEMSRELIRELGDLYSVTYSLTFAGPHRDALRHRAEEEPLPGWSLKD